MTETRGEKIMDKERSKKIKTESSQTIMTETRGEKIMDKSRS